MAQRPGIFPTFFLSGFECSCFLWKDQGRRDLVAETRHREHAWEDYRLLHELGIAVAREGIPWPMADRQGKYDFSSITPFIEAMKEYKITAIWDLCHYGYPDDLDPYQPAFRERFGAYCRAAATHIRKNLPGPYYFTPINEITFFSFCGAEWGWVAPYGHSKEERMRFRLALCHAAIEGVKAIREVIPEARMIHVDPLVQVVAPRDRPDQAQAAWHETYVDTFLAWDVIYGKEHPELGGAPDILDIVGANNYSFGQMEYREHGPHAALPPDDDRIQPLCELLKTVWERYRRPMIISETSGMGKGRAAWMKDVTEEALAAVNQGMDLQAICLFPAVDMPDWHTGKWLHNGICDMVEQDSDLLRVQDQDYVAELRRWQKELNRVTRLDEDPYSDPVELNDVIEAARRLQKRPDKDWC
ncbi:glycoside hydrolase family 1 protein [Noviherbaspirillum galbum]|uniref:B-glycosidase n=1 Tax=Noviherbaspirillum galbum TaxID=2709383 RepID=A0A6B3SYQ6_9BURK|nr:b-glycosidase [Noviherbaspirillum galbum]NEX63962.1 b-glycosidase [Noviherbaspirillum galbum]